MDVLIPILGILVALVPVAGLTVVLTLRLGGKPFVETLARELRGTQGEGRLELRVAELTEQVDALTAEVHELRSARSFDEKLLGASGRDA